MHPDNLEQLKDDLVSFRTALEDPNARSGLVEAGLPRILTTLEMIPDSFRDGDVLELGSSPYFLSICLYRLCTGNLKRGNYFGPDAKHGADRLVNQRTGEEVVFDYEAFNIETDEFPYADSSFDLVVFSELIEHLGLNPVMALSEIHRVLRPGGIVIVTTPNSLSLERLETYLTGGSQMVDKYSPALGYGARHNREYHPRELCELLEGTGFAIEKMVVRNLLPHSRRDRLKRACYKYVLARFSNHQREEHIFLRARRGERFRWQFPPTLFDNIQFYVLVKYPWMEMGINDSIQCAAGWCPLERHSDGVEFRWIAGEEGQAFLKAPESLATLGAEVLAAGSGPARFHVTAWDRWLGRVMSEAVYVDADVSVDPGRWQQIKLAISGHRPRLADEVEVKIRPQSPSERECGLAVRRVWFGGS